MPRIPVKRNSTTMSGQGPGQTINDVQGIASLQSRGLKQLGGILQDVGGDFGNIAMRMQQTAINNEESAATTEFSNYMAERAADIAKAHPLDQADMYEMEADKWIGSKKFKYKAAQNSSLQRIKGHTAQEKTRLTINGLNQVKNEYYGNLPNDMSVSIEQGRPEWFDEKLKFGVDNGLLMTRADAKSSGRNVPEDRTVEFWQEQRAYGITKYLADSMVAQEKAMLEGIGNAATAKLDEGKGLEDVLKFIDSQEALNYKQKSDMHKEYTNIWNNMHKAVKEANEMKQFKQVNDLFGKIGSFTVMDINKLNLDGVLDKQTTSDWQDIAEQAARSNPPETTDWQAYGSLKSKLYDYWSGRSYSADSDKMILTEFARAYAVDKSLSEESWEELKYYMNTKVSPEKLPLLISAWDTADEKIRTEGLNAWNKEGKAKRMAETRRSIFEQVMFDTNRKKGMTPRDAYIMGQEYGTASSKYKLDIGSQRTYNYTATNKKTGQQMGSDDGKTWTPIQ